MKRMSWLLSLVGLSIILSGCSSRVAVKVPTRSAKGFVATTAYHHHTIEQTELHKFVHDKLVTSEGIYTNYLASNKQQSQATGHEMLLESSGLWLTYLAQTKQNKTFLINRRSRHLVRVTSSAIDMIRRPKNDLM